MPPIQEISETAVVQNQAPSPLSRIPSFPRRVLSSSINGNSDVYDEGGGFVSKIPSTAEQCKEFINITRHQSIPALLNNNNNIDTKNYNYYNKSNLDDNDDEDDDCWNLTSLDWLQDKNLLRRVITNPDSNKMGSFLSTSPIPSDDGKLGKCNSSCKFIIPKNEYFSDVDKFEPLMPDAYHPTHHADCKPPYSFSCLIFMAIENSPEKRLPVKDIYAWIQNNFPFFSRAPSGWKNSVRHNLSLNKCFTKVEKDRGGIGKGSYWCVDPTYKANLLHALRKTPYQPFHQMQMVSSNHASAPFGIPLTSQEISQTSNLKSLFPYVSKRSQGKQTTDTSEIDVANALVSLRKSGTHLNKSSNKDQDEEFDEDEWVDEDVDDDEADDDDEETISAEMVHMLKRKLGQQKVKKDFYCTPSVSVDHQYGMTDDRVRDILTRFDCFDDCCSLSSMSDEEDDEEGGHLLEENVKSSEHLNLLADIEIKLEIKEEPMSGDETRESMDGCNNATKTELKDPKRKSSKLGIGKRSAPGTKKSTGRSLRAVTGFKRKRKISCIGGASDKGEPLGKQIAKDLDEEEQRARDGADALLELATNMAVSNGTSSNSIDSASAKDVQKSNDESLTSYQLEETNKKTRKRGRPITKRNEKQKVSRFNTSEDDMEEEFCGSKRGDGKKRLPKDFVPNGLTSLSSAPRSFQSKRLQMRYLEQIVTSNETAVLEQTKVKKMTKSYRSKMLIKQTNATSNNDKALTVYQSEDDLEELNSKDWTLNFSSIDLSEVNAFDLAGDEILFDSNGNKMVKEEPFEEIKIKEEVVDDYENCMH